MSPQLNLIFTPLLSLIHVSTCSRNGGDGTERFTLSAGFPPREVLQASDSLVDAGLVGAAIVQKSC